MTKNPGLAKIPQQAGHKIFFSHALGFRLTILAAGLKILF